MTRTGYSGVILAATLVLVVGLTSLSTAGNPARAATVFTVNSTDDNADQNTADSVCDTGLLLFPSGERQCTLRAAIEQANATAGADDVRFNISGSGVHTISPSSALPDITDTVTVDGYSQPKASPNTLATGNDAVLLIEINGANAGPTTGLRIAAPNSVIKGLAINRFQFVGLFVDSPNPAPGNRVEGNFIGTDPSGTLALSNAGGVLLNEPNSVVGGNTPAARNVVSGNTFGGVSANSSDNRIEGNYIGTAKDGTSALGNGANGVWSGNSRNTVGGSDPSAANVIAFNGGDGVRVVNSSATGSTISYNSIFSNVEEGIDLNEDGRTANDDKDADTGPNNLQNFPVLASAKSSRTSTLIKGKLNGTPGQTFTVRFFAAPKDTQDEGKTFIGELSGVTTDATTGDGAIMVPVQKVKRGWFVTATATNDATGDTSEFSEPKKVGRKKR